MGLGAILDISGSAMTAQSVRLNATASNLANAQSAVASDGEPYRATFPVFQTVFDEAGQSAGVRVAGIVESTAPPDLRFEPDNPLADEEGYVAYPNVNVVQEMTDMISASRSFQMNVELIETAKTLAERLLSVGR